MMSEEIISKPQTIAPLSLDEISVKIKDCPRLPSLSSINSALRELLNADQRYTYQISEIIRRDPSLTARLLRLVNSVYYGLTTPVNSIEEAVFYLGIRQIRQLAMVTPVIEDFQKLTHKIPFPWRDFWQHCIGTAILTREVIGSILVPTDESDYVAGLVHDVGKIVMASVFPLHFSEIYKDKNVKEYDLLELEKSILGINHSELGAMYLRLHNLPDIMIEAVEYHHQPERANHHAIIVAAVHIADLIIRYTKIGYSGNTREIQSTDWENSPAWGIIFPGNRTEEKNIALASLKRSIERLPHILEGLV
jgi:HD-like signal output (HDOD) protein